MKCLRCQAEMDVGGLFDPGGSGILAWVARRESPIKLGDLITGQGKMSQHTVKAYHCPVCGFVELSTKTVST